MTTGSCVEDFSVCLDSRSGGEGGVYIVGDVVKGALNLQALQHIALTSMRITIKGRAFVHWTEQSLRGPGEPRFKDTRHHSSSEDYFEQTLVLFGQKKNEKPEKCYIPAGRYTYPFQYQLPANIPCSFEGEFGYIRYWVRAVIEKGREQCHVTKMPFTVISPLDLNAVPDSNTPVQESTEKKLCCFCCLSGPITAMLCLQKRGFVPGEPIKFGAEVSNLSSRKVGCYSVELKMTTLFKTPIKCRSMTKQVCKIRRSSVGKGDTDTWMSDQLVVPSLPPSCLMGCGIISVKYTLELRVDPVGPAFDLTLPIEVVIGTLPHRPLPEHHYANVESPQNTLINQRQTNGHNGNPHNRYQQIGVAVLPVQGGQLIVNPAYMQSAANHSIGPQPSTSGAERLQDRHRASSRASSAPSTASTLSLHQSHMSAVFAESAFGRMSIKFEDDFDLQHRKYAPVYPYYQIRR